MANGQGGPIGLGNLQSALTGVGSFVDAFKGWDQAGRANRALANQIRMGREREELLRSQIPEGYQLSGGGGAGQARAGRSRGARGAGGVQPVSLEDALRVMAAEDAARQQQIQSAEGVIAAEQAGAERRGILEEGPRFLRAEREMEMLGAPRKVAPVVETSFNPWTEEGARRARFEDRSANPWGLQPGTPQYEAMMERRLSEALGVTGPAAPPVAAPPSEVVVQAPASRVVQKGDTLSGIAQALQLPASDVIEAARPITHPGGSPRQLVRDGKVLLSGSDLIYPDDKIPLPLAPSTAEDAVDPATVSGSEESVAAGLSGGKGVGPLASKLLGLDKPGTIEEAKAQIAQVNKSAGLKNPVAEFSGVVADTYLPSMKRLNYAIGLAKNGDRALISSIMGRSVGRSEVKNLDKLVANYRDYTQGVELKADEIYQDRVGEAMEREAAKGDLFGDLAESAIADFHPKLSPEEVGVLADQIGRMSVYDRQGASAMLNLWKGMRDTELREIARRSKGNRDRGAGKGLTVNNLFAVSRGFGADAETAAAQIQSIRRQMGDNKSGWDRFLSKEVNPATGLPRLDEDRVKAEQPKRLPEIRAWYSDLSQRVAPLYARRNASLEKEAYWGRVAIGAAEGKSKAEVDREIELESAQGAQAAAREALRKKYEDHPVVFKLLENDWEKSARSEGDPEKELKELKDVLAKKHGVDRANEILKIYHDDVLSRSDYNWSPWKPIPGGKASNDDDASTDASTDVGAGGDAGTAGDRRRANTYTDALGLPAWRPGRKF